MKWEIRKEGIDNYILEYGDKMLPFHSNVGIVMDLQGCLKSARLRMIKELKEQGITISDLVVATKDSDGKTIYDNSSRQYMEDAYVKEEQQKVFDKVMKDTFGMSMEELILDIGIEDEEEVKDLAKEIGNCLIGKTPSRREQPEQPKE